MPNARSGGERDRHPARGTIRTCAPAHNHAIKRGPRAAEAANSPGRLTTFWVRTGVRDQVDKLDG
jgi:hypothetical protein